jgi:hypothetical protein
MIATAKRPTVAVPLVIALALCAAVAGVRALVPNLECPTSPAYPKDYFRDRFPAQDGYMGTTSFVAYVQVDVTGEFDLVKVANFTGTYVRHYSRTQRRPIDEYFVDIGGVPVKVTEITTTPLDGIGQYCLNFDPPTDVPEHVEGVTLNDRFLFNAYYDKTARGARFGEITRTEFFNFARNGADSLNILSVLDNDNAGVESMAFFKFHRASRRVDRRADTDAVEAIDGVATRSIDDYTRTFALGNGMRVPIDVVDPAYRHLFA